MTVQQFVNVIKNKYGIKINPWTIRTWQKKGYLPDLRDGKTNFRNFDSIFVQAERSVLLIELGFDRNSLGDIEKEEVYIARVKDALKEIEYDYTRLNRQRVS